MKVKICGITHPDDATFAACFGADYIGIVFANQSQRKVSLCQAKEVADAARDGGAEPVGVFAGEALDQICSICEETGIRSVQLHGSSTRQDLWSLLEKYLVICAIAVDQNGCICMESAFPDEVVHLYDSPGGGRGISFNWALFSPPRNKRWILAGGLRPGNVCEAIRIARPCMVDVSTGVEIPGTVRKDRTLVQEFIKNAKYSEVKT